MLISRLLVCLGVLFVLAGCGAKSKWATDQEVAQAFFKADGPSTLTLFTVINNRSKSGAHSGLLINGSQRVIFDPAGTWYHPDLPERNDVHFGMTDDAVDFYVDYHARITFHVVIQEVVVSPAVAEKALQLALAHGPASKARCSISISSLLRQLPGFESVKQTWYPKKLMDSFATLPGVKTETVFDNDPDDNTGFILAPRL